MPKVAGCILKAEDVDLQGQFLLDVPQASPTLSGVKATASAPPQVRIIENHPDFAVIEIVCCCGARASVKCEYAAGQPVAEDSGPPLQNGANKTPDRKTDQTK